MRDLTLFLIQFQSLRFACRLKGNNNTFFAFESLFRYFDSRFNLVRNTKIFSKTLMRGPNKTQHSLCHFCITLRMNPVLNQFESLRFACRLQIDDDTFFTCYSLFFSIYSIFNLGGNTKVFKTMLMCRLQRQNCLLFRNYSIGVPKYGLLSKKNVCVFSNIYVRKMASEHICSQNL